MENKYKLKYQGKWMTIKHQLGSFMYTLTDNESEADEGSLKKMSAIRAMVSTDNDLDINEIELIPID